MLVIFAGPGRPTAWPEQSQVVVETVTKTSTTQKFAAVQQVHESDATKVMASGAGLQHATANKEATFTVDTSHGGTCAKVFVKPIFICNPYLHTHTHPFNSPLYGTTQVSRYQKGKTSLDFTEARDSEWQWHQLGHMQVCTLLQTVNHASTPPLSFLQARCPSCRPTNSIKALKNTRAEN